MSKDGSNKGTAPRIMETTERQTVQAKYNFTSQEKKEIADKMAQRQIDLVERNDERKTVMASFNDKIKSINLDISKLSRGYRDGWEYRDYECTVIYDYNKKEKSYKDVKTGEVVDKMPFVPGDEQKRFL